MGAIPIRGRIVHVFSVNLKCQLLGYLVILERPTCLTRVLYRVTVLTARHCSDALFRYFSKNVYWLWLDVREPRKVPRTVPGGCPGGAVGGTVSMVCRCARSPIPHAIVTLKMTVADFLKTVRLRTPPHRDGPQRRR